MKLSENFTLDELVKSQTAIRRGIKNEPNAEEIAALKALAENVLQPIRDYFKRPVVITSGFRGEELNHLTGGSVTSQHCLGEAGDLEIPGVSNFEIAKWVEKRLIFDQCILEFYTPGQPNSGWVHVSYTTKRKNRKQTLTAYRQGSATVYKPGLTP
ncbi:hypothetical protein [Caulobacter phage KcrB]|nr:hypothetical protein RW_GP073c [Caulobacter phage RW]WCA46377.1 hypothetical protein [Caulobacter phage KcrB]WCD56312.1 hypothetical protein [Caulobacter phage RLK]WNV48104.1 endolysin [Caulobacter phage GB2A]